MLVEIWLIFALDPKVEMENETLVLDSVSKLMCLVVATFSLIVLISVPTGIVYKKVYVAIWPA